MHEFCHVLSPMDCSGIDVPLRPQLRQFSSQREHTKPASRCVRWTRLSAISSIRRDFGGLHYPNRETKTRTGGIFADFKDPKAERSCSEGGSVQASEMHATRAANGSGLTQKRSSDRGFTHPAALSCMRCGPWLAPSIAELAGVAKVTSRESTRVDGIQSESRLVWCCVLGVVIICLAQR